MKTTIRTEAGRLWYALKIAAGQGPAGASEVGPGLSADMASEGAQRDPALVVISRAGRSNVQAQHRNSLLADGSRPAYALPYNPDPVVRTVPEGPLVGGDAGLAV